jgi:hypothetical protein
MTRPPVLQLDDLNPLDVEELMASLPAGAAEIRPTGPAVGVDHGQLDAMTLFVACSPTVLQLLGAWLLKARKRSTVRMTVTTSLPDGAQETREIVVDTRAADAPDAQLLQQLQGFQPKGLPGTDSEAST